MNVTLFENNYINPYKPNTYEATFLYLIRKCGELSIYTEHQLLGIFSQETWELLFKDAGFILHKETLTGLYEENLLNNGEYPLTIFIGQKIK